MRGSQGFSLIEVMIATALLASALVALAQLVTASIASNLVARDATSAAVLASQKVDELRSMTGAPADGTDYVDRWGAVIGSGTNAPHGATFVRTWTIQPFPASTLDTIVIHVRVARIGLMAAGTRMTAAARVR